MSPKTEFTHIDSTEELASYLGLSRWTVSRVLNGHEGVHQKTRQRVLDAIEELDFKPNAMARGLRGGKTGLIGVCFQEIDSPILARKVSTLQNLLRSQAMRGVLELTAGEMAVEISIIQHFLSLKVDGIILIGSTLPPEHMIFEAAKDLQVPIIGVDPAYAIPVRRVLLKRQHSMQLVLSHLSEQGLKKFVMLGIENDSVYGVERIKGLKKAAHKLNIDFAQQFISIYNPEVPLWSYQYGFELGLKVIQEIPAPAGIIALNDRMAIGAMQAIQAAGKRVPQDYAIVGYDALDVSEWSRPPLTTVSQETEILMQAAVEATRTVTKEASRQIQDVTYVTPRLIIRKSSLHAE